MSRIGKKLIEIPQAVLIDITKEQIKVTGTNGVLEQKLVGSLNFTLSENKLLITRNNNLKETKAYHGLMRALVQNMILGVTRKFSKSLIAEGVGYKFQIKNNILIVNAGYTHVIEVNIPIDLEIKIESLTKITISGINKERVGFLTAQIRNIRLPEPYKGKGILFEGEIIRRKVGKTGK